MARRDQTPLAALAAGCALAVAIIFGSQIVDRQQATSQTAQLAQAQAAYAKGQARLANVQADEAKALAAAIKRSRIDITRSNCTAQNAHNASSVAYLTKLANTEIAHGAKKKATRAGLAEFKTLINALTPHQDCTKLVAEVGG